MPIVEAAIAALFVAVTMRFVVVHQSPALPAYLCFAAAGLALAVIDFDTKRLPDKIAAVVHRRGRPANRGAGGTHDWWALVLGAVVGVAVVGQ